MPEDDDFAAFIYERLGNRSDESHKIQIIKPEDANKLNDNKIFLKYSINFSIYDIY